MESMVISFFTTCLMINGPCDGLTLRLNLCIDTLEIPLGQNKNHVIFNPDNLIDMAPIPHALYRRLDGFRFQYIYP